jgi:hypothetical protein
LLPARAPSTRWTIAGPCVAVGADRRRGGFNRNHNRIAKEVFKSAATAAATRSGALQEWYQGLLAGGMREELARVTLARKLAALTLRLWKTGARYDATKLTMLARLRVRDLEATGGRRLSPWASGFGTWVRKAVSSGAFAQRAVAEALV